MENRNLLITPLDIGTLAPNFTLPKARGGSITLRETLEERWVVLVFYRGGW